MSSGSEAGSSPDAASAGAGGDVWTPSVEVHFFDSVELYPPNGPHRSLHILGIRSHLRRNAGVDLTATQVTERVDYYWGDAIEQDETPKSKQAGVRGFTLPDEYAALRDQRAQLFVKPRGKGRPVK
eukprot:m51a1_g11673 hypothetical protein (126) ;mRNA; r:2432-2905